jgi:two-component system, OmpR family, alkaline phosphatase synthesis response regulator PhoP
MKVLIAEDDPITLETLAICLRAEGFYPLTAPDGATALALWEQHRPDLCCLDVMMPALDGFELCRRIRARDASVPILFLSAKNEELDVVVGLELGADDFIRKPFTRAEVLARIRAVLRRTRASDGRRSVQMHDLTVWAEELRAARDGAEIELTPREAAMLALLHEHAGRPVPRDLFLERCWGLDYFPDSRTLDQHVANLRKKVERDPASPEIIETVRGIGYRYRQRT